LSGSDGLPQRLPERLVRELFFFEKKKQLVVYHELVGVRDAALVGGAAQDGREGVACGARVG
jgi:hypothetical protein